MTRTGASPRLCAHSPEPFIEIHPADAKARKLTDGGFAKVTTQFGSAILKVAVTRRPATGLDLCADPLERRHGGACTHRRTGRGGERSLFRPARAESHAGARRTGRIRLSGLCADAASDRAAGRHVVCARRSRQRRRTFVCDQRAARFLARLCRHADDRRRTSSPNMSISRAGSSASPRSAPGDSTPAFSSGRPRRRRNGTWCVRCSRPALWPSATAAFCCQDAAATEWPRPDR